MSRLLMVAIVALFGLGCDFGGGGPRITTWNVVENPTGTSTLTACCKPYSKGEVVECLGSDDEITDGFNEIRTVHLTRNGDGSTTGSTGFRPDVVCKDATPLCNPVTAECEGIPVDLPDAVGGDQIGTDNIVTDDQGTVDNPVTDQVGDVVVDVTTDVTKARLTPINCPEWFIAIHNLDGCFLDDKSTPDINDDFPCAFGQPNALDRCLPMLCSDVTVSDPASCVHDQSMPFATSSLVPPGYDNAVDCVNQQDAFQMFYIRNQIPFFGTFVPALYGMASGEAYQLALPENYWAPDAHGKCTQFPGCIDRGNWCSVRGQKIASSDFASGF